MLDENGNLPGIERPFLVDAIGTCVGALTGNTTVTTFVQSTSGVEAGGRTGLTALVTGVMFLLTIFLAPPVRRHPVRRDRSGADLCRLPHAQGLHGDRLHGL